MSVVTDPALYLGRTPVFDRLNALSRAQNWYDWAGYLAPGALDAVEFEYFALRNQVSLFDVSPMHKYRITGPDADHMLNRMMTRDVTRIAQARVGYTLWCDTEGMLIDDGTLFHLGAQDWRLCCQEPSLGWLTEAAWGYDVTITDESHSVAGLALQGPSAFAVLESAGFEAARMRPFDIAQFGEVTISRTGFTGDLGYELWCPWDYALGLWDRLWQAGALWGMRAIGYEAVNIARIEAGFLTAGVDFQPAHTSERLHRGATPFEVGLGRLVDFDKGHFNGRRALYAARKAPRFTLLRVDVEGFKPANGALIYHRKRREVGHVTSGIWSPTAKRNVALARVETRYCPPRGGQLWTEIYTHEEGRWDTRWARLTPQKGPFFAPARARATPPAQT
ncbi:aminomethyltransferase family protein [Yoonia sp.]|uniref:aminomethyltransferase family protein n=1 Tax=Yoonia sp. TaxID=2212373 RepID=UPI002FDB0FCC